MQLADQVVVVTGAARGIGRALAERFAEEGARAVVIADLDAEGATTVANQIGGVAVPTNVAKESDIIRLVEQTERMFGRIDLFCSNAGIIVQGGAEVPDHDWQRTWEVNVRAHIYAARAVLPGMIARGSGYLLQTASAAGLLTQIGSAPYSVTKHAALAFAEWLSITYGDDGLVVSVLAPQAVRTAMTAGVENGGVAGVDGMLEPDAVADAVVAGLASEAFLILPHPEVLEYFRRKASDYDRWIRGMRRLQRQFGDLMTP